MTAFLDIHGRFQAQRIRQPRPCRSVEEEKQDGPTVPGTFQRLAVARPDQIDYRDVILLQAFNWESAGNASREAQWYKVVHDAIPLMQKYLVTHVWLPPPTKSVDKHGYMPTQLYDLDSNYGSFESLRALNAALMAHSLRPVADIVINHRSAEGRDSNGVYNVYEDRVDHPGASLAWDGSVVTCNDPFYGGTGRKDSGFDYEAAADIDHTNPLVVEAITDWLRWMRENVGFEGFRLDFALGYSPAVAEAYLSATLNVRPTPDGSSLFGDFAVGEGWVDMSYTNGALDWVQDAHRQVTVDWLDGVQSSAFDFTLKGVLQYAIEHNEYHRLDDGKGRAPGVNGWWPSRAVTFLDNHDTGSTQRHWPFPKRAILQGYAYILTHPGIPCLFWDHVVEDNDNGGGILSRLVNLRAKAGIRADSKLEILRCTDTIYVAKVRGTKSDVLVKLGPEYNMGDAAPNSRSWDVWASGTDWAVWLAKHM